jgi:hypothetical protein
MGVTVPLPVLNLATARFACTFGRGCEGTCCREGRPPVYPDDLDRITPHLDRFLAHLRPAARRVAAAKGVLVPRRRRLGQRLLRVVDGWCIFFRDGCVLHRLGHEEGDKYRYKPALCALFPIQQDRHDHWYVRQKGYKRERWDLPCLDPAATTVPAADSLGDEIALAQRYDDAARIRPAGGGDRPRAVV